jgi:hypothetical protein
MALSSAAARRLCALDALATATFLPARLDILDRGIGRDDDRLTIAARRNCSGVEQIRARRLRGDWRGVARVAVVDRSGSERFEQRRPKREFDPSDPYVLWFKALLEDLLRLHDQKRANFLIADAQFLQRPAETAGRVRAAVCEDDATSRKSRLFTNLRPSGGLQRFTRSDPQLCPFHGTSHASRRRMPKEKAKAQTAMMPMPTKTTSVARNCAADMMR